MPRIRLPLIKILVLIFFGLSMFNRFLIFSSALVLSSCAYMSEKSIQDVTILTPGAHNAQCYVYSGGLKYTYWPPETITIAKSQDNLVVDCKAPGNRRKEVIIEPAISSSVAANIVNGMIPGTTWDYASQAMYRYPPVVEVDFRDTPTKAFSLPAQNRPDIRQPEDYDLEEFRSGRPRLNEDRYAPKIEIQPRQAPTDFGLQELGAGEPYNGTVSEAPEHVIGTIDRTMTVPTPPSSVSSQSSTTTSSQSPAEAPQTVQEQESNTTAPPPQARRSAVQAPTNLLSGQ